MFRVRFVPKTSYVSVVETRVFCWVQFFLRWIFRFQQMSGILWGFLWTSDYKLWTIIVPWIRPAIRVFYLKEGGVVSGGILKFPWSFFSPGWCAIWRVDPTHQEGGRTDFFLHIFSFWVTHIPYYTPEKNERTWFTLKNDVQVLYLLSQGSNSSETQPLSFQRVFFRLQTCEVDLAMLLPNSVAGGPFFSVVWLVELLDLGPLGISTLKWWWFGG